MSDAVESALRAFDEFVGAWVGPAAQRYVFAAGNTHADRVREAIQAAAATDTSRRVGWAVFKREHDTDYDRERPSGYVHTVVSAVFESLAQAQNAHEYCTGKHDGDYIICELQETA
jgi:hypothetical protein